MPRRPDHAQTLADAMASLRRALRGHEAAHAARVLATAIAMAPDAPDPDAMALLTAYERLCAR